MRRKIMAALTAWKNSPQRLPLLIYGARQVGKTYALKRFGAEAFADTVYVNFEKEQALAAYLEVSLSPEYIIRTLENIYNVKIDAAGTLIIFDEIQSCERALTALKYFAEEGCAYHIAAAGSLLGVRLRRERFSFPVGKVKMLNMYPMDFEEFLWACGQESLAQLIRQAYADSTPLPELLHRQALQLYQQYLLVGGMPAAVGAYTKGADYRDVQGMLYNSYIADMTKYTERGESVKIAEAYDSLPAQLAKENKKFQYKMIKKGARASLYGSSLDWLVQSGIALKCTLTEQGLPPLAAYEDLSCFKLYFSDTGIFSSRTQLSLPLLQQARQFMGALTENYAAISLKSNGYSLNYWTSDYSAEVDFVITKDDAVIPVECKADVHVRSRSLQVFMRRYQPPYGLRLSARNFGWENNIRSVPLYAVFCL